MIIVTEASGEISLTLISNSSIVFRSFIFGTIPADGFAPSPKFHTRERFVNILICGKKNIFSIIQAAEIEIVRKC